MPNDDAGTEPKDGSFREIEVDPYTDDDTPADEVRTVSAKDGDTFTSLAREHLKDSARRKEIARLNPHLEGQFLADGDKVKIPGVEPTLGRYIREVAQAHGVHTDPALQDPNHPKSQDVLTEARAKHRAHLAHAAENEKRRLAYEKK